MDATTFMTIIGTAFTVIATVIGAVYTIMKHFKSEFKTEISKLDDRIFQLAMGKSFKEILLEEKIEDKSV